MSYELSLDSGNLAELEGFNKIIPAWCKNKISTRAELLMQPGLPLPVMPPQSALLIGCRRVNS